MNKNNYPLSNNQRALYLHTLRSPTNTAFNIPLLLKIEGRVKPDKLMEGINDLAIYYPLKLMINEKLENVISEQTLTLQEITLTKEELCPFLIKTLKTPFNLNQDLLIRFYYIKCDNEHAYLYIIYHHLLTDDLSQSFIIDLKNAYECRKLGNLFRRADTDYSYADYVAWEKEYIKSNDAQKDMRYWRDYLNNDIISKVTLASLTPKKNQQIYSAYKLLLPFSLRNQVIETSKKNKISAFTLYVAALFILLKNLLNQKDNNIAIATVINNRFNRHFDKLLGDFTNTVILQEEISNQTTDELLKKIFISIMSAIKHGKLSYYEVIKEQKTKPQVSASIVFHQAKQIVHRKEDSIRLSITHEICQIPNENFNLEIIDDPEKPILFFKYNNAIFDESEIIRIAKQYLCILHELTNSTVTINDISFPSFSVSKTITKEYLCIHQEFEKIADKFPNLIAIRYKEQDITYQTLNNRANQLALLIKEKYQNHYKKSLCNEVVIGIYLAKSIDAIVAMLAILKTGSCYLPLDTSYPIERTASLINQAQASLIITKHSSLEFLSQIPLIDIEHVNFSESNFKNLDTFFPSTNLAYLIFTSGTTGKPNGVAVQHNSVVNLAISQGSYFNINENLRIMQFASLAFDASTSEIWSTLLRKGTLCIPTSANKLIGTDLSDYLINEKIDVATIPPSILATITQDNIPLKTLIVAGETANPLLMNQWRKKTRVINAYGPTEATVCATMHEYQEGDLNTTIGKPLEGATLYLLDEHMHPVSTGIDGEIYIGGIGVARGYYNHELLTNKKFISYPPFGRLYKTGDRGRYLPDGNIEYRGRFDTQLKIRGFRIEIEEIENSIHLFSKVKQAAIAVDTAGDEVRLIAFILPNEPAFLIDELKKYLASILPTYMLPNDYIQVEEIPLTANDKIDRKKLLTLIHHETSFIQYHSLDDDFVAICAEVLKLEKNKIDLSASFFELGGTSLTVLKLISHLNKRFDIDLSIATVFNAKSLELLLSNLKSKLNIDEEHDYLKSDLAFKITSPIHKIAHPSIFAKTCLLTGATGFLGAHLLANLLKETHWTIYCLIRARHIDDAKSKLENTLKKFELEVDNSRIKILLGDLRQEKLGLTDKVFDFISDTVNHIFHCGAEVNHIYPYNILRAANVLSTLQLLNMAQKNLSRIHYISTIDTITSGPKTFDSEENPLEQCEINWGYIQSKWVSEKMISQSTIPFSIYRPGNITGHSLTGISSPHKNHAFILLKSCIESQFAPEWDMPFEMTPVDCLSEIIVKLALRENQSPRQFYNLHNPTTISWKEYIHFINEIGHPIRFLPEEVWINTILSKLDNNHPLFIFKELYQSNALNKLTLSPHLIKNIKTSQAIKNINCNYTSDYKSLIHSYLNYFKKIAFID